MTNESDLDFSHGKMSDFLPLSLFGLILFIKLRNFSFEINWNTLIFFNKKSNVRFEFVLLNSARSGSGFVVSFQFWQ